MEQYNVTGMSCAACQARVEKAVNAVIEWNLLSYIRDASQLGENKVCFNLGHFNWEELGAKYAADWIPELVGNELPVRYVKTDDMWNYAV